MAFVFKIKLEGTAKPPVWRKVKINENATFYDLHLTIQGAFGWDNSHLYEFSPTGYGSFPQLVDDEADDWDGASSKIKDWPNGERFKASKIKLNQYFTSPKQKMVYLYDFGDDWKHTIELVEITDGKIIRPVCLAGKGTCPPDDSGGVWGYYHMVEAINNPKHPAHADTMEWLGMEKGETWDTDEFDLDEANGWMTLFFEMD